MDAPGVPAARLTKARAAGEAAPTLVGGPLLCVRVAWIVLLLLLLALFAPAGLEAIRDWRWPIGAFSEALERVLALVLPLSYVAAGLAVFWRTSDRWAPLAVSLTLLMFGALIASYVLYDVTPMFYSLGGWRVAAIGLVRSAAWALFFSFFMYFPDGIFLPRWTRWLAGAASAYCLVWLADARLDPHQIYDGEFAYLLIPASLVLGTPFQIYRYIVAARLEQRRQMRWLFTGFWMSAIGAAFVALLVVYAAVFDFELPEGLWYVVILGIALPLLVMPVCIAVAVLTSGLWDVEPLIYRSAVYGLLTGAIALTFFGGIAMLQQVIGRATGQTSEAAIVISTITSFALIKPFYAVIQRTIDRRFYRRKYNARRTLAAFGARARDEVNLSRLVDDLQQVVDETVQPAHASLLLLRPPRRGGYAHERQGPARRIASRD